MWNPRFLYKMDWRVIPIIAGLMIISLLVIGSTDPSIFHSSANVFFTPKVKSQFQHFCLGWAIFLFFAAIDYNKIREWAWFLYLLMLTSLIGIYFVPAIQGVHRWYRFPLLGASFQPSESAKLIVVITLSWFLEKNRAKAALRETAFLGCVIVAIPFFLILKQPDLGTALVLCPIALVMFYLGNVHPFLVRCMTIISSFFLCFVLLIFLGILSHETLRPYVTQFIQEYQYERLNPNSHHQRAAQIAIGVGGITGSGWRMSEYTGRGWLPYGYTDSVFSAFGEEFGLLGLLLILVLFYSLIYFSFQVTAAAKDHFGRMLSAGVTVYLAMHVIVNVGMMCGFFPITGVPLILVSYGGSSIFVTMAALGILQSVYSKRFMF